MISPVSKSMELEKGEIVVYQPDDIIRLEVQVNDDTVWLTQSQMSELFQTSSQNITIHIRNIYAEGELLRQATCKDNLQVHTEGSRRVRRNLKLYNLDVIISVGYRVKSIRGTQFRQWANNVLKDYLIRGYALNHRFAAIEETILKHGKILDDHERKIDLFVRTSLPPVEGVFYDGQIFDAYVFVSDLIKSAKVRIVLMDNYVDEKVLVLLSKRIPGVSAEICTASISRTFQLDLLKYNCQYESVNVKIMKDVHDRFLIIDDIVYHIGASLKDLGKKLFAFSRMSISVNKLFKEL